MEDQGFDWDNLNQNTLTALRYVCQKNSINVPGKAKKDYVSALAQFRRGLNLHELQASKSQQPISISPELQPLIQRSVRNNNFSSLHQAKSVKQFHENERKLFSRFANTVTSPSRKVNSPIPLEPVISEPIPGKSNRSEVPPVSPEPTPTSSEPPSPKVDIIPLPQFPSTSSPSPPASRRATPSPRAATPVPALPVARDATIVLTVNNIMWIIAALLFIIVLLLILILCML